MQSLLRSKAVGYGGFSAHASHTYAGMRPRASARLLHVSVRPSLSRKMYFPLSHRSPAPRHASTSAAPAASTNLATGSDSKLEQITPDNWALPFESLGAASQDVQAHIGYLKELGFDYGWGPTSFVQWSLEHVQVGLDLPVWGAAAAIALITRIVIFPLTLNASDTGARMKAMGPRLDPLRKQMTAAMASGDKASQMAAQGELRRIQKAAGIRLRDMFMPILVQAPLGFGLFRLTRGMADLPVPGLDAAGFAWISNLALPDPYFVLPAATAGMMYIAMKRGMDDMGTGTGAGFRSTMVKVLPFVTLLATGWMPALTQVGFGTAAVLQFFLSELLRQSGFRRLVGIHPMVVKQETDATPYQGTITIEKNTQKQSDATEQASPLSRVAQVPSNALKSLKETKDNLFKRAQDMSAKKHSRLSPAELKSAESYESSRRKEENAAIQKRKERERQQRLKRVQ